MSWEERLREAAYTSPLGARIVFQYTDVSRTTSLRNAPFEFVGIDGVYVQPNGFGALAYPMRCFFSGPDCDTQASLFEEALTDIGIGRLEHPMYGAFDAMPTGDVTRNDALATEANQAVVEVTFFKTMGALYPSGQRSARSAVLAGLELFTEAAAAQFAGRADLSTVIAKANAKATVKGFLQYVSAALSAAAAATAAVTQQFRTDQAAVNGSLDVLVGQPVLLAQQVVNLINDPARALSGIESRLAGYRALAARIIASAAATSANDATALESLRLKLTNEFATSDLFAMAAVSGSVTAALNTSFTTRPQAIGAALEIASQLDAVVAWRDARFDSLAVIDEGVSYQALQELVALTLGYLIETSFTLSSERRIVLQRPRTIVDLCAELYGSVDDKLDFMIDTNSLTGAEILELPVGRTIVYYG